MQRDEGGTSPKADREAAGATRGTVAVGTAAFLVVLCRQAGPGGDEAEWRWRVRSVASGRERCFRRLGDVLAFLSEESGDAPPR